MPIDNAARMASQAPRRRVSGLVLYGSVCMTLLLLEALLALVILIAIVWWTMFAGRNKGELKGVEPSDAGDVKDKCKS